MSFNFFGSRRFVRLAGLFLVALSVRGVILWKYPEHDPVFSALVYTNIAHNIIRGRGLVYDRVVEEQYTSQAKVRKAAGEHWLDLSLYPPPAAENLFPYLGRSPAYFLFMALNFWIFGAGNFLSIKVIQILFDSLAVLLLYDLGRRLFNEKVGCVAGILAAFFVPIALHATLLLHDSVMPFFVSLAFWIFFWTFQKPGWKRIFLCGAAVGLGLNFRESLFLLAWIFGFQWFLIYPPRQALRFVAIFGAVVFLTTVPWRIWNYTHYGRFNFSIDYAGSALLDGIVAEDIQNRWGFRDEKGNFEGSTALGKKILGKNVWRNSREQDKALGEIALKIIKTDPFWYLKCYVKRVMQHTFNPWSIWSDLVSGPAWIQFKSEGGTFSQYLLEHPAPFFVRVIGKMHELSLFLLFLVGIYHLRKRWREMFCLFTTPFVFILSYCVFNAQIRFILPGKVPFFLLASAALVWLYEHLARSKQA